MPLQDLSALQQLGEIVLFAATLGRCSGWSRKPEMLNKTVIPFGIFTPFLKAARAAPKSVG
jgi:hypothetical protein